MSSISELSEYDLDVGIQEACLNHEQHFCRITDTIGSWIADCIGDNARKLDKISRKLHRHISLSLTNQSNTLDGIVTRLESWLRSRIASDEWALSQVAVKAGLVEVGQTLDDVLWPNEHGVTEREVNREVIVLDCTGLSEHLSPLVEVLREIRDVLSARRENASTTTEVVESAMVTIVDGGLIGANLYESAT